jgi:hypothetical protein
MSDEKDPYEEQQEALDDLDDDEAPDPETELEGQDVRPGGDSTPQVPPRT